MSTPEQFTRTWTAGYDRTSLGSAAASAIGNVQGTQSTAATAHKHKQASTCKWSMLLLARGRSRPSTAPRCIHTAPGRPRRQRQAATTVELQQLVATVRTQLRQQLYRHFFQHDDGRTPAPAPPSRWRSRRPSFCGRSRWHPVASHHPPHPPRTRERSRPPRGAWLSSSWGLIVDCT